MLRPIEQHCDDLLNETLDVPVISQSALQFLHTLFNYSTVSKLGILLNLKAQGYSDAYLAGFAAGLHYCSDTLDSAMVKRIDNNKVDIQF